MTYSLNEATSLMLKAALGSGLPMGLAEDCAAAGNWLLRHGHDGAGAVCEGLMSGCIIWTGPSILDGLTANPTGLLVEIEVLDAPLLLLGMAGSVLSAGSPTLANSQFQFDFSNGSQVMVHAGGLVMDQTVTPGCDVEIARNASPDEAVGYVDRPLQTRVTLTPAVVQELTERAARTYVPATETSRERGAGAGLTDND
jgi:hypothetical protein